MTSMDWRRAGSGIRAAALALAALAVGAPTASVADGAPAPAKGAEAAAVPAQPSQTAASFGDWVVRCDRVGPPAQSQRVCEAAQSIVVKDQPAPVARIAFGRGPSDKPDAPLLVTVLLPLSIAFDRPPRIGPGPAPAGAAAEDPQAAALTFRRCLPGGCFADVKADAALLKVLRDAKGPGHLTFADAAERTIVLPVSFRGLPQALDDLAVEVGKAGTAGR